MSRIRKLNMYIDEDKNTIEFVPVKNVPGFSSRVILNKKPVDWLSKDFKPNKKSAEFYFNKHLLTKK